MIYTLLEACNHVNKYIVRKPEAPYDPLNIEIEAILTHKISFYSKCVMICVSFRLQKKGLNPVELVSKLA